MVEAPGQAASNTGSRGLTSEEARRRRVTFGPNSTPEEKRHPWLSLARKFWAPVPWMLEATIMVELWLGKFAEAGIIAALLAFNAAVAMVQEGRAHAALELLRHRLSITARAMRDGSWQSIPAVEVVPGDWLHLRVGDVVPADIRVGDGALLIDQSTLTGESLSVEVEPPRSAYAGTTVVRGEASGEVIATGVHTRFGRTAELVSLAKTASHLERVIMLIVRNLVLLDFVLAAGVVAFLLLSGGSRVQILSFGVVLLLASVPVALPATFTLASSLGAVQLSHHGVLATRLSAIEEAASMDVVCLDKTGTLTQNRLAVRSLVPYQPATDEQLLLRAAQASDASTQDPIDLAILDRGGKSGGDRIGFVPFDPKTKRSEATLRQEGGELRVMKGAPQAVAPVCSAVPDGFDADVERLAAAGDRVLAVAAGPDGALAMQGLIGLQDPPRPDSKALIERLRELGLAILMVTGDGLATARAVAAQMGLSGPAAAAVELKSKGHVGYQVLAEVLPEDKFQLVRALQQEGHLVGMTGDGVNDAPALRQAEVGIAVASATDVAKAAASLVLTEHGLGGIVAAVEESRRIYQRMLTYALNASIKKLEIPVFLCTAFLLTRTLPLSPLLAVLLLIANDFSTMTITTDRVSFAGRPDRWRVNRLLLGSLSVAIPFVMLMLAIYLVGLHLLRLDPFRLQTLSFLTLVVGSQLTIYLVREPRAFWRSRPGPWLLASSSVVILTAVLAAWQGWLMAAVSLTTALAVVASVAAYAAVVDVAKVRVFSRLGLHKL